MKKSPWYIWLSLFALALLWIDTSVRILVGNELLEGDSQEPGSYGRMRMVIWSAFSFFISTPLLIVLPVFGIVYWGYTTGVSLYEAPTLVSVVKLVMVDNASIIVRRKPKPLPTYCQRMFC